MSTQRGAILPIQLCIRCARQSKPGSTSLIAPARVFSSTAVSSQEAQGEQAPSTPPLDPNLVANKREERKLIKTGVLPIGSRRRRAALRTSAGIPFEQLPYQCFQEARKILKEDRAEKIEEIQKQRERIARVEAQDAAISGGRAAKEQRLRSMRNRLEELKILADINDPLVKKRFEDGEGMASSRQTIVTSNSLTDGITGDMNRPIYRYLADKKWRSYKRLVLMQRVEQMDVTPDVLPAIDPTADVSIAFGRRNVQPGEFVDSRVSEIPAKLKVQVFDKGERMVTVVVVDSDVPAVEKDGFTYRCHFIASNIPISPTSTSVPLGRLSKEIQVSLPWLPPFAQKGSPYHRLSVFVLQQKEGQTIDVAAVREKFKRDGFKLRSFVDKYGLQPVGVNMFRTQWDEGTAGVMKRHGIEGADVEFKRKRIEPLPYKKKDGARYR